MKLNRRIVSTVFDATDHGTSKSKQTVYKELAVNSHPRPILSNMTQRSKQAQEESTTAASNPSDDSAEEGQ